MQVSSINPTYKIHVASLLRILVVLCYLIRLGLTDDLDMQSHCHYSGPQGSIQIIVVTSRHLKWLLFNLVSISITTSVKSFTRGYI